MANAKSCRQERLRGLSVGRSRVASRTTAIEQHRLINENDLFQLPRETFISNSN